MMKAPTQVVIPILGMTGAALIFICALLVMFGVIQQVSVWGAILALPIFANEMILAVWLMVAKDSMNLHLLLCLQKRKRRDISTHLNKVDIF